MRMSHRLSRILRAAVLGLALPSLLLVPRAWGAPEGTLTYAVHVTIAPTWFDPADVPGIITPFMVLYAVHDALFKPMPQGLVTPSLAESWSVSKDYRVFEFVLRKGVTFHNGDPLTTEDVKFSFERYRGAAAKLFKEKVEAVQIVDPHRVRFYLKEPWTDFMTFYGTPATGAGWIVPKKYVEKVGDDEFRKAPIGAGPYKFVSHTPGVEVVLEANEKYWRKTPNVKRIVMKIVKEGTTRVAMVKRGEAQVAYLVEGSLGEEVKRDPNLRLEYSGGIAPFWVDFLNGLNDPKSPWHNQKVRLAANYAIDRKAISEAETLGASPITGSIIPREFEYALPVDPVPYDPKKAKQLLAEAGYPNGFDTGTITPVPPYYTFAEAVAGYLGAVGIKVKVQKMERAVWLDKWRKKELQGICLCAAGALGNAHTRIENYVYSKGAFSYIKDPEINKLFEQQVSELDLKKREALLHQIQRIIVDKVYFAPIYQLQWPNAVHKSVKTSGLGLIKGFYYTGPFEDITLQ
ncbi:MAG: ABC transporter substrate-binding protein [Candidatus Rokubacteria bacterium]|nr:ABC transporter substrate-binding protein [Candidatus Rokubacteria bacterium]